MKRGRMYTIPLPDAIYKAREITPDYMRRSSVPYAFVGEGVLSNELCDALIDELTPLEAYKHPSCDATTREAVRPFTSTMKPIVEFSKQTNATIFGFQLDENPGGWFQTYTPGQGYPLHSDGDIGQSRKLTTIVMLSDPSWYMGGVLRIVPYPGYAEISNVRGTMVTFPSWMLHEVTEVTWGIRQTLNVGFWGNPFT